MSIEEIRSHHYEVRIDPAFGPVCNCGLFMPCEAIVLLQEIEELTAENEQKFSSVVHECCVDVQALKAQVAELTTKLDQCIEGLGQCQRERNQFEDQLSEVKAACDDIVKYGAVDWTLSRYEEVTKGIDA